MKAFSILLFLSIASLPVRNEFGHEIQKFSSKYLNPFNPYLKRDAANYVQKESMSILQKGAARAEETVKLPPKKRILYELDKNSHTPLKRQRVSKVTPARRTSAPTKNSPAKDHLNDLKGLKDTVDA